MTFNDIKRYKEILTACCFIVVIGWFFYSKFSGPECIMIKSSGKLYCSCYFNSKEEWNYFKHNAKTLDGMDDWEAVATEGDPCKDAANFKAAFSTTPETSNTIEVTKTVPDSPLPDTTLAGDTANQPQEKQFRNYLPVANIDGDYRIINGDTTNNSLTIRDGHTTLNLIGQNYIDATFEVESDGNYNLYFKGLTEAGGGLTPTDFLKFSQRIPIAKFRYHDTTRIFHWFGLYNRKTKKREWADLDNITNKDYIMIKTR